MILQASINVIGALDTVSQAVGQPADDVRRMCEKADRWMAVEHELRAMLAGVSGANLVRRAPIAKKAAPDTETPASAVPTTPDGTQGRPFAQLSDGVDDALCLMGPIMRCSK